MELVLWLAGPVVAITGSVFDRPVDDPWQSRKRDGTPIAIAMAGARGATFADLLASEFLDRPLVDIPSRMSSRAARGSDHRASRGPVGTQATRSTELLLLNRRW